MLKYHSDLKADFSEGASTPPRALQPSINQARAALGEFCKLPQWVQGKAPAPNVCLYISSLKIAVLVIFMQRFLVPADEGGVDRTY